VAAASVAAGRLVGFDERASVADAVGGGIEPGSITFPLCRDLVDAIEVVPEALIVRALALVRERHGRMIEGAGALPVAALLHSPARWAGRTVVLVASGGNEFADGGLAWRHGVGLRFASLASASLMRSAATPPKP